MKILFIIFLSIIIAGLIYFFYLGYQSQTGNAKGLVNGKLSPCSKKPNCICTEYPADKNHFTDAISYSTLNIDKLKKIILASGGIIISQEENYIAATYTSLIFRYVDDFEIRIDKENKLIHIRSASRVGHSDMGANLKRVEKFKRLMNQL